MTLISQSLLHYFTSELKSQIKNQNEVNENFTLVKEILSSRSLDNDDDSNKDHFCKIGKDVTYFSTIIKNHHNKLNYSNNAGVNKLTLEHKCTSNTKSSNLNHFIDEDCAIAKQFAHNKIEIKNIDNNPYLFINHLSLLQESTADLDIITLKIKKNLQDFQKIKKNNKIRPIDKSWVI